MFTKILTFIYFIWVFNWIMCSATKYISLFQNSILLFYIYFYTSILSCYCFQNLAVHEREVQEISPALQCA